MNPTKNKLERLARQIAEHQANIQKLGVNYGADISERLAATESKLMGEVEKFMLLIAATSISARTIKTIKQAERAIRDIRAAGFDKAHADMIVEAEALAANEAEWARSITLKLGSASKLTSLSESKVSGIVKNGLFDGKTLADWFRKTQADDLSRIVSYVTQGTVSGWTIAQMRRGIMGTRESGYTDGLLNTTRREAETMARTITSGVANDAKLEFYRANPDAVAEIEILSTLDGRTCPHCASLDRTRYAPEDPIPQLPIHPNCRCVYLPVTPTSDIGESPRPAANSDFEADAKRAYEKKHPDREYDKLAASTRKKYYYQAIRDFESSTGEKAFSQGAGGMNFKDYFLSMSEQQKKDWLGAERYRIYRRGNLPLVDFIRPYPDRKFTVKRLREMDVAAMKNSA